MIRRLAVAGAVLAVALVAGVMPAFAHATISGTSSFPGNSDQRVTMDVPEERGDVTHNADIKIYLPPDWAGRTCDAAAPWHCTITPNSLEGRTLVQWTKDAGAGATAADETFAFGAHTGAPGTFSVPVIQTYANNEVVRWNDSTADTPAPKVTVTAAQASTTSTTATPGPTTTVPVATTTTSVGGATTTTTTSAASTTTTAGETTTTATDESTTTTTEPDTTTSTTTAAEDDEDDGGSALPIVLAVLAALAVAGVAAYLVQRRPRAGAADPTDTPPPPGPATAEPTGSAAPTVAAAAGEPTQAVPPTGASPAAAADPDEPTQAVTPIDPNQGPDQGAP